MNVWAIVVAAGRGERFGGPKQFATLRGRMVVEWSLLRLAACPSVVGLVVVLPSHEAPSIPGQAARGKPLRLAEGGATRALSVLAGLRALPRDYPEDGPVLVHDAVRPCVEPGTVERLIAEAGGDPAGGLLGLPLADSLKRADGDRVEAAVPREGLWRAQTPQLFPRALLERALAAEGGEGAGDEAEAVGRLGLRPRLILGAESNLKITRPEDLRLAAAILAAQEGAS